MMPSPNSPNTNRHTAVTLSKRDVLQRQRSLQLERSRQADEGVDGMDGDESGATLPFPAALVRRYEVSCLKYGS